MWLWCIGIVCYQKVVANRSNLLKMYYTLAFIQGSRAASPDEVHVVTEVSTFFIYHNLWLAVVETILHILTFSRPLMLS